MSITISKFDDQARGYFDGGSIKERKPVSFESPVKGQSTLFYWAQAWSDEGGLIEEHPHKGFEIISYVIEGGIEHKDSTSDEWVSLKPGDMQVIRAGNGVTHAERFLPGTRMFQIWLDPDFRRSLQRPATYSDYEAEDFEVEEKNGMQLTDFLGDESPAYLGTNVRMERYDFDKGNYAISVESGHVLTAVVISGSVQVDDHILDQGDLVQIKNRGELAFQSSSEGAIFILVNPVTAGYRTYNDQLQL